MNKKALYLGILFLAVFILAGLFIVGNEIRNDKLGNSTNNTNINEAPGSESTMEKPESSVEQRGIMLNLPGGGQNIQSPLRITGSVEGDGWISFEAQTGTVELLDGNGRRLAFGILKASVEDWMTSQVPFETTLTFASPETPGGTLVFRNENPSGRSDLEREFRLPVTFASASEETSVKVFFGSTASGSLGECENVLAVERKISETPAVGRAALEELLKGPTEEEKSRGFLTSVNPGVRLQSLDISNGVARVDFSRELDENVGGSCRVEAIRAQIEETLKQFPTVQEVVISIDGRTEDILQP
jgi:hypothetical protein